MKSEANCRCNQAGTSRVPDKLIANGASPTHGLAQEKVYLPATKRVADAPVCDGSSVHETAYNWDLTSDTVEWDANAAEALKVADVDRVSTGKRFNALIASEHVGRRLEVISSPVHDEALQETPYYIQFRFQPGGRRSSASLWLEDRGFLWRDKNGVPVRARGIVRVIGDEGVNQKKPLYHADHDELTGQLNRIRLTEALGAVITRSVHDQKQSAFLMISITNLSMINETFGFDVGDELITAVGQLIRQTIRAGDTLGRYSSNKFGVVLGECGSAKMQIAAERLIKVVRSASFHTTACPLTATISIGGVIVPDQSATPHQAMGAALQALEYTRFIHRDCFVPYVPSSTRESLRQRSISIADDVISALDDNRMRLVLQPLVNAKTQVPEIYECLLRLHKEDGSIIAAGDFIPTSEQIGLSRLIDHRTLELVVDLLKTHPHLKVAMNVSGLTSSDNDWLISLGELTKGQRDITERMIIEITETAAIEDLEHSEHFVDSLKDMGCKVAIDDFGAGYTSFKNLKRLNVDMLKIDGAFVKNLSCDNDDKVFIDTMVEIAGTFKLKTVAEWVGDVETARILANAGVDYLQGYYYGQPIPAENYVDEPAPAPMLPSTLLADVI